MTTKFDSRINRLVGQIQGIRKMIHEKRSTQEIAQQVLAAREALSKIGLMVVKDGISNSSRKDSKDIDKLLTEIFRM